MIYIFYLMNFNLSILDYGLLAKNRKLDLYGLKPKLVSNKRSF